MPDARWFPTTAGMLRATLARVETVDGLVVPTWDDVEEAHQRIGPHIRRTEIVTSARLDELSGASLFFKAEGLQPPGAFKVRGAANAVFGLSDGAASRGVATHSSGNHGAALAYAAQRRGIPCEVVMPHDAPAPKRAAVEGYGARVTECEPATSAREATLAEVQARTGAEFVHPYDDPRVIAGQATCARELVDQVDGLDIIITPIGGGGLISGTSLTVSTIAPGVEVHAAEPLQADDAARSLAAARLIVDDAPSTIADGLRTPLSELTWRFVSRHVTAIHTVTEQDIVEATRLAWNQLRLVVEPSSAVAVAAILGRPEVFTGRRIGVILTGGNVDIDRLPWR